MVENYIKKISWVKGYDFTMLEKYIVAEISHRKKDYLFQQTFLDFDENKSSLILQDDEIKQDIDKYICYLYAVLRNMVKAGIYSSLSSAERAIRNNVLKAELSIIYITDIEKAHILAGVNINKSKTLQDLDKYCSAIHYMYSLNDDSILRYEIYGEPLKGDYIDRSISELIEENNN